MQSSARRDILDELLHMMSCKAAVKAGQRLSPEEIESLLMQRHLVDDAHHCPHGRPTALSLSRMELDRQFGRLGIGRVSVPEKVFSTFSVQRKTWNMPEKSLFRNVKTEKLNTDIGD